MFDGRIIVGGWPHPNKLVKTKSHTQDSIDSFLKCITNCFRGEAGGRTVINCIGCTPRFSITRHVSPVSFGSRPSIPLWYYASSAMLLASPANLTQFLLGWSKSSRTNSSDYGIGGLAIQWIESYLTGRSQFVRFNGVTSRTVPVTSGVPQGSVLGPILFISYSAAVIAIVQHHGFKVHAFADDLQIYGSTAQSGAADLMARMSNCVESVASWMSSNRLRLNPSKTELIWLGTSRRLQHCAGLTMSVCGADVRPVECVRDLGVLIDSNMTLLKHVNNVAGICFYQLRQLRIIRRSLTTEAAHSLVRALIHTRVDYCNGHLAAGPKYLHEKLQCVLRAAARLVLQLPHRASVSDIMRRQLHRLEMPDRIRFKLCTLVFRCLHGLAPRYLVGPLHACHVAHTPQIICDTWKISVSPPGRKPSR